MMIFSQEMQGQSFLVVWVSVKKWPTSDMLFGWWGTEGFSSALRADYPMHKDSFSSSGQPRLLIAL